VGESKGDTKPILVVKAKDESGRGVISGTLGGASCCLLLGRHLKSICCDPKDGELYLCRMKTGETLLEVRTNTDVQIVCQI